MNKIILADIRLSPIGGFKGPGPLMNFQNDPTTSSSTDLFETILSTSISVITIIGGVWFMFLVFTGALGIIGSKGDKQAYESAKKKITTGLTGLVIIIAAIFLIDLIGVILGLDILNVGRTIRNL